MPGLKPVGIPSKGQGERPGIQLVFSALLDDFIGVCKGTEVVLPEIWRSGGSQQPSTQTRALVWI